MNGKRIIIAGGTGFIGRAIARELAGLGADVVVLTRTPERSPSVGRQVHWDGKTLGDWTREVDGADAVINLAGKNVNCRYTPAALAEVDESRVNARLVDLVQRTARVAAVDVLAGEVDDGAGAVDLARPLAGDGPAVPEDLAGRSIIPRRTREDDDVVAVSGEVPRQRLADEAAAAGDDDSVAGAFHDRAANP